MLLPVRNGQVIVRPQDQLIYEQRGRWLEIKLGSDLNIRSCTGGQVFYVGKFDNRGNQVIIQSGDTSCSYIYMDTVFVKPHQIIKKGDDIGAKIYNDKNQSNIVFYVDYKCREISPQKLLVFK